MGELRTSDGRHVFGCGGAAAGEDGTVYLGAAVEENDPAKAAGKIAGAHPYAMRLLIYRRGAKCGGSSE